MTYREGLSPVRDQESIMFLNDVSCKVKHDLLPHDRHQDG